MAINFIPHDTKIDFMSKRYWAYGITAFMIIASIIAFLVKGLIYGIDFKGGLVMEVRSTSAPFDLAQLRSDLSGLVHGEVALQEFGSASDILIRIERQPGGAVSAATTDVVERARVGDVLFVAQVAKVFGRVEHRDVRRGDVELENVGSAQGEHLLRIDPSRATVIRRLRMVDEVQQVH